MHTALFAAAASAVMVTAAASASNSQSTVQVLRFDDVATTTSWTYGTYTDNLGTYGGFSWGSCGVVRQTSGMSGYVTGLVSGNQTMFTSPSGTSSVSAAYPWSFVGAYMTGAWNTNMTVTLTGLLAGATVHSMTFTLGDPTGPTWVNANFTNIDTLRIQASGGTAYWPDGAATHLAIDDFTALVPAPGAVSLLLVAGAGRRNRRRNDGNG